jgi:hypothetical protein
MWNRRCPRTDIACHLVAPINERSLTLSLAAYLPDILEYVVDGLSTPLSSVLCGNLSSSSKTATGGYWYWAVPRGL